MKNKITNDEKLERVKKRKILKAFIIFFGILTIIFSILSLLDKITPVIAIIFLIIESFLSKYRNKLDPKVKEEE